MRCAWSWKLRCEPHYPALVALNLLSTTVFGAPISPSFMPQLRSIPQPWWQGVVAGGVFTCFAHKGFGGRLGFYRNRWHAATMKAGAAVFYLCCCTALAVGSLAQQ